MKSKKFNIKQYFQDVNSLMSFSNIALISIIVSILLIVADYKDIISNYINDKPLRLLLIIGTSAVAIIVIVLFKIKPLNVLRMSIATDLDYISFVLLFSSLIHIPFLFILRIDACYKLILLICTFISNLSFILARIHYCSKNFRNNETSIANLYDLKDVYENNIEYTGEYPILISENAVDYDLLHRDFIINYILSTIENCSCDTSFVIGLEGAWGSGKTTIINNVIPILKENKDNIIIDDFDPWLYGTQEALLSSMFEKILQNAGIRYSSSKIKTMLSSVLDIVAENHKSVSIFRVITNRFNNTDVNDIKNKIVSFLKRENKTIIFFIDNLDRADANNIIFLFKLISIVFDLPRVVYVLSYDRDRINKIFESTLDIDRKYMEKIIQQEIKIPQIQADQQRELYLTCIKNIVEKYEIDDQELTEYSVIFDFICDNTDIRNFKRLINSVFSIVFENDAGLYKRDLLAIEVIRFFNPFLYNKIYQNRQFFISFDRKYDIDIYRTSIRREEFNKEGQDFYTEIFDEYPQYKKVLMALFPYAKKVHNKQELISQYDYSKEEYNNVYKKSCICSMKYFDLYFSYGSNAFLAISKDVKTFIEVINLLPSNDIDKFMKLKINGLFFYEHSEWFEKLQVLFDDFSTTAKENAIMALYNHLDLIDDTPAFLTLHARDRACVIIAKYLCGSSKQYAIKFSSDSNVNYRNIVFMNRIISLTEHIIDDIDTSIKQENIKILNNTLKSMCEEIICQKINIYDTEYYFQNNIWSLKQNTDEDTFNEYISWILSDANLYRVIADALGCSIGNQYKQYISKESFNTLLLDNEKVENFFSQNPPQSDSERYIVDLYNSYINSTSEENNGIITPNFVKLDL